MIVTDERSLAEAFHLAHGKPSKLVADNIKLNGLCPTSYGYDIGLAGQALSNVFIQLDNGPKVYPRLPFDLEVL